MFSLVKLKYIWLTSAADSTEAQFWSSPAFTNSRGHFILPTYVHLKNRELTLQKKKKHMQTNYIWTKLWQSHTHVHLESWVWGNRQDDVSLYYLVLFIQTYLIHMPGINIICYWNIPFYFQNCRMSYEWSCYSPEVLVKLAWQEDKINSVQKRSNITIQ